MESLENIGKKVKDTTKVLRNMSTSKKNKVLLTVAEELEKNMNKILEANKIDVKKVKEKGMRNSLIDRLLLTEERVIQMSEGLKSVVQLTDPVGEILEGKTLENGLEIMKKRVPIGVIAIIYESRPNVTVDAFGLCFKSGNSVILRCGSDSINSNIAIINIIRQALIKESIPEDCVYLIEDTSRKTATELMRLNRYVDVLIPRGGSNLIKTVVQNSTVPIIETGTGNCHIYVDESAKIDMAINIIENSKTQRTGVCNSCESLVVHKNIANQLLPLLENVLSAKNVEIRGDKISCEICKKFKRATEEDFGEEYLDLIISVKIVENIEEAIEHINKYSTKHSESIITSNYENARKFLNEIDSSTVYVNASTRFTDGGEFGYGAEIGISTQKLHARGPMGIRELTTTKYEIFGNGQIRA